MDREDAHGVLIEWMTFLADTLTSGMIAVGGEVRTDVTSGAGRAYRVHVRSAAAEDGRVDLVGRIHTLDQDQVEMIEERGEMELPAAP